MAKFACSGAAHVFVSEVLEQLELSVCSLRENGGTEWFHNLLDSNILVGELVSGGAAEVLQVSMYRDGYKSHSASDALEQSRGFGLLLDGGKNVPDQTKSTHSNWLEIRVSAKSH